MLIKLRPHVAHFAFIDESILRPLETILLKTSVDELATTADMSREADEMVLSGTPVFRDMPDDVLVVDPMSGLSLHLESHSLRRLWRLWKTLRFEEWEDGCRVRFDRMSRRAIALAMAE